MITKRMIDLKIVLLDRRTNRDNTLSRFSWLGEIGSRV